MVVLNNCRVNIKDASDVSTNSCSMHQTSSLALTCKQSFLYPFFESLTPLGYGSDDDSGSEDDSDDYEDVSDGEEGSSATEDARDSE